MTTWPQISVVTLSFNQGLFLRNALDSVLRENYPNLQYIVVDPGSIDGSRKILEDYKPRIDRLILEPDKGPADGLNKGFSFATGEILYYLNADDEVLPGAFFSCAQYMQENPIVDILLGHGIQINSQGVKVRSIYSTSNWTAKNYAHGVSNAVQQATFIRQAAFNKTRGFNVANHTCWDGELLVDLFLAGCKFGYIDNKLGAFRLYPGSITGSGRLMDAYHNDYARIFYKVMRRHLTTSDKIISLGLRILVKMRHPVRFFEALKYKIRSSSAIT